MGMTPQHFGNKDNVVLSSIWGASSIKQNCPTFRFVPEQIVANKISLFNLGAKVPKQIVKYQFCFSIWEWKFQNEQWNIASALRFEKRKLQNNSESGVWSFYMDQVAISQPIPMPCQTTLQPMSGEYAAVHAGSVEVLLSAMFTNFHISYLKRIALCVWNPNHIAR